MFVRHIIIIAAAVILPAAASAQQASVAYHPYELKSAGGRQAIVDRIKSVTGSACADGLVSAVSSRKCRAGLSGQMLARIGNPELLAQWQGRLPVAVASAR